LHFERHLKDTFFQHELLAPHGGDFDP
jgi:hypothetical protein